MCTNGYPIVLFFLYGWTLTYITSFPSVCSKIKSTDPDCHDTLIRRLRYIDLDRVGFGKICQYNPVNNFCRDDRGRVGDFKSDWRIFSIVFCFGVKIYGCICRVSSKLSVYLICGPTNPDADYAVFPPEPIRLRAPVFKVVFVTLVDQVYTVEPTRLQMVATIHSRLPSIRNCHHSEELRKESVHRVTLLSCCRKQ